MTSIEAFIQAVACFGPIGRCLGRHLDSVDLLALVEAIPHMCDNMLHIWPVLPFLSRYFPEPREILALCDGQQAFISGPGILLLLERGCEGHAPTVVGCAGTQPDFRFVVT